VPQPSPGDVSTEAHEQSPNISVATPAAAVAWSSPAFVRQKEALLHSAVISGVSPRPDLLALTTDELIYEELDNDKPRKRTKFGRKSGEWTFKRVDEAEDLDSTEHDTMGSFDVELLDREIRDEEIREKQALLRRSPRRHRIVSPGPTDFGLDGSAASRPYVPPEQFDQLIEEALFGSGRASMQDNEDQDRRLPASPRAKETQARYQRMLDDVPDASTELPHASTELLNDSTELPDVSTQHTSDTQLAVDRQIIAEQQVEVADGASYEINVSTNRMYEGAQISGRTSVEQEEGESAEQDSRPDLRVDSRDLEVDLVRTEREEGKVDQREDVSRGTSPAPEAEDLIAQPIVDEAEQEFEGASTADEEHEDDEQEAAVITGDRQSVEAQEASETNNATVRARSESPAPQIENSMLEEETSERNSVEVLLQQKDVANEAVQGLRDVVASSGELGEDELRQNSDTAATHFIKEQAATSEHDDDGISSAKFVLPSQSVDVENTSMIVEVDDAKIEELPASQYHSQVSAPPLKHATDSNVDTDAKSYLTPSSPIVIDDDTTMSTDEHPQSHLEEIQEDSAHAVVDTPVMFEGDANNVGNVDDDASDQHHDSIQPDDTAGQPTRDDHDTDGRQSSPDVKPDAIDEGIVSQDESPAKQLPQDQQAGGIGYPFVAPGVNDGHSKDSNGKPDFIPELTDKNVVMKGVLDEDLESQIGERSPIVVDEEPLLQIAQVDEDVVMAEDSSLAADEASNLPQPDSVDMEEQDQDILAVGIPYALTNTASADDIATILLKAAYASQELGQEIHDENSSSDRAGAHDQVHRMVSQESALEVISTDTALKVELTTTNMTIEMKEHGPAPAAEEDESEFESEQKSPLRSSINATEMRDRELTDVPELSRNHKDEESEIDQDQELDNDHAQTNISDNADESEEQAEEVASYLLDVLGQSQGIASDSRKTTHAVSESEETINLTQDSPRSNENESPDRGEAAIDRGPGGTPISPSEAHLPEISGATTPAPPRDANMQGHNVGLRSVKALLTSDGHVNVTVADAVLEELEAEADTTVPLSVEKLAMTHESHVLAKPPATRNSISSRQSMSRRKSLGRKSGVPAELRGWFSPRERTDNEHDEDVSVLAQRNETDNARRRASSHLAFVVDAKSIERPAKELGTAPEPEAEDFIMPEIAVSKQQRQKVEQLRRTRQQVKLFEDDHDVPSGGLHTSLSYFTPLSDITLHLNSQSEHDRNVDILAVVSSFASKPKRATAGPKDHFTTLHVTGPVAGADDIVSPTQVQIFRPRKEHLPIADISDIILLRNFVVRSAKGQCFLLSTASSAWCVWRYSAVAEDGQPEKDCRGPPVETGSEEEARARELRNWWVTTMRQEESDAEDELSQHGINELGTTGSATTDRL
jgi:hypothetical protein